MYGELLDMISESYAELELDNAKRQAALEGGEAEA